MRILLDTQAFIWWDSDPSKLSRRALAACQDSSNSLMLSIASVWEMQIKLQLGKLKLNVSLAEIIAGQQQTNGVQLVAIVLNHVLELENLADHHKDPFDRLLIAQAIVEDATVISNDPEFPKYQAKLLW